MRQSWDLRPAGTVGGARLLFMVSTGFLLWLAWGQIGAVQAQDPSKKGEPAAAKTDEVAAPAEAAEAAPAPKTPQASTSSGDDGSKPPARENMLRPPDLRIAWVDGRWAYVLPELGFGRSLSERTRMRGGKWKWYLS